MLEDPKETRFFLLLPVQDLSCYLVDNNGFVVLSKERREVRSTTLYHYACGAVRFKGTLHL